MIVVADTSPINYLVLIEQVDLLRQLYQRVIIPEAVYSEAVHPLAPPPLRQWISSAPNWLEIHRAPEALSFSTELDVGETEALTLASHLHADLVLLDDSEARHVARQLGISFTGILGILGQAAAVGLINMDDALLALSTTSFFASAELIERVRRTAQP
jgi:predicted nucleic acid-binding protein